jgi:hypothetical protein
VLSYAERRGGEGEWRGRGMKCFYMKLKKTNSEFCDCNAETGNIALKMGRMSTVWEE